MFLFCTSPETGYFQTIIGRKASIDYHQLLLLTINFSIESLLLGSFCLNVHCHCHYSCLSIDENRGNNKKLSLVIPPSPVLKAQEREGGGLFKTSVVVGCKEASPAKHDAEGCHWSDHAGMYPPHKSHLLQEQI
jgi:hypothetical protein